MKKNIQQPSPIKTRNIILTTILILSGIFILSFFFLFIIGVSVLLGGEGPQTGNVGVIEIKGTITADGQSTFSTGTSASTITKQVEKLSEDPLIEAVVIEINSPGGSPVGSAEIASAIQDLHVPTVAWIREAGASGGYWVASATDHIISHELSVTGSIGVIGSYLDFSQFLADKNITYQRLVSGEHKDTGSPLRSLSYTEEQLLQQKMDLIHEAFIKAVATNRNLSYDHVSLYADGMYLLGSEALDAKLVDELGGKKEVTTYLESLNITPEYRYVKESTGFFGTLNSIIATHGFNIGEGIAFGLQQEQQLVRT